MTTFEKLMAILSGIIFWRAAAGWWRHTHPTRRGTRRILIVEDDAHVRTALARLIRHLGHLPLTAADGEEALLMLRQGSRVDLILLDLDMRGMSGTSFRRMQLADDRIKTIPVVVVSGIVPNAGLRGFLGPVDWVQKPFEIDVIRRAIERAVGTFDVRS